VVKTRMQTNPEMYGGSVVKATRRIVADEGVAFLAQGLGPTFAGYGVEGALKFGFYELLKPVFAQLTDSKMFNYLCASVVAGAIASVVLCPAEEVRIKMVANPDYADGPVAALQKITAENGPLATFNGFSAMCAKQVPYTMGKQVSFDFMCECVRGLLRLAFVQSDGNALEPLVPAVAAFPAAIIACVLSHPGDMLLTAYYKGSDDGVFGSLRRLLGEGGITALFRGLRARLIHVISIIWVQLMCYDYTKQLLGLPATGH